MAIKKEKEEEKEEEEKELEKEDKEEKEEEEKELEKPEEIQQLNENQINTNIFGKTKQTKKDIIKLNKERVSTGIKNFDTLIEGGFKKNSTNLLVGSSGSGKSIFALSFLMQGIKKGDKCLYITFEEPKKEFYSNMLEFGWDLEKLENQGKFIFLEYTPEKVKTMLEEGGGTIENIVLTKKINRIVIDSITSFELLFEKELEKRESALELFRLIRKWDCTSLLTYEGSPSMEKRETSRILDFESDSITILYFERGEKQRIRSLEVLKMRGTTHSLSLHNFSIDKNGINIGKGSNLHKEDKTPKKRISKTNKEEKPPKKKESNKENHLEKTHKKRTYKRRTHKK